MKELVFSVIASCMLFTAGCGNKTEHVVLKNNPKIMYAVSKYPTPVLNTADFDSVYGGADGKTLKKSSSGLVKELEYVAFEGSVFEILQVFEKGNHKIYKVRAAEYEFPGMGIELFIDSRFVDTTSAQVQPRKPKLPSKDKIISFMESNVGALYVWGGNNVKGVKQMPEFYSPRGSLNEKEQKEWELKGVDCSGLIYEATDGYTARNTHQLVRFGSAVNIEGLKTEDITSKVQPLDLIVWKGHVIIILDSLSTIQSAHSEWGVVKKPLSDVLDKLQKKRKPVNEWSDSAPNSFVIRRWYPENK